MTASSEVAAADIGVPGALIQAGFLPAATAAVTHRVAIAAVALVVTSAAIPVVVQSQDPLHLPTSGAPAASLSAQPLQGSSQDDKVLYYYYPSHYTESVLIRMAQAHSGQARSWTFVQNAHANYQRRGQDVVIRNAHLWNADLSVMRLPTDDPTLRAFLDRMEGHPSPLARVKNGFRPLLVIQGGDSQEPYQETIPNFDATDEEYFMRPWPRDSRLLDRRDKLHKQGWCYFQVSGYLGKHRVKGSGCLPLIPSQRKIHTPQLQLSVGEDLVLVDTPSGAFLCRGGTRIVKQYPQGSFFKGLSRPWIGLHTLDTVRRDAAQHRLSSTIESQKVDEKRLISVSITDAEWRYTYRIDMNQDLLKDVYCFKADDAIGHIHLDYSVGNRPIEHSISVSALSQSGRRRPTVYHSGR